MTQAEIEHHLEISERFLQQAEAEFEMGDLLQASEKAWGAVAHYLKSVAKYRGWQNRTHRDLTDIAFDLAYETDSLDRINYLYDSAGSLHANFYEDSLSHQLVPDSMTEAEELISGLYGRTRPPPEVRPSRVGRRR